jgi:hypothetical protein
MAQVGSSCVMALDQFNVVYVAWMLTVSVALGVLNYVIALLYFLKFSCLFWWQSISRLYCIASMIRWLINVKQLVKCKLEGKSEVLGEEQPPVPLCPSQISHYLTRGRNPASMVGCRRVTVWVMARPKMSLMKTLPILSTGSKILYCGCFG